jgi:hypothetical protein
MVGDRRVVDMAASRADAVDAAPAGSVARALREDLAPGSAAGEVEIVQGLGLTLKRKREEVELAKLEADREAFMEECRARQDEAKVRQDEATAKKLTARASIEAAEYALEEARRQRRLSDAEMQRQVLWDAKQASIKLQVRPCRSHGRSFINRVVKRARSAFSNAIFRNLHRFWPAFRVVMQTTSSHTSSQGRVLRAAQLAPRTSSNAIKDRHRAILFHSTFSGCNYSPLPQKRLRYRPGFMHVCQTMDCACKRSILG